ncbi:hypothetical protein [Synechococcus sp. MIT S9508]|uniref:hypothetical protein n=1 Tax=Synechococcus sp. MIT S9508 TaxID=1801629 RepID=UPI000A9103AF|nr:hypothetical protein [Synechococcus sp. MIT S9508]
MTIAPSNYFNALVQGQFLILRVFSSPEVRRYFLGQRCWGKSDFDCPDPGNVFDAY